MTTATTPRGHLSKSLGAAALLFLLPLTAAAASSLRWIDILRSIDCHEETAVCVSQHIATILVDAPPATSGEVTFTVASVSEQLPLALGLVSVKAVSHAPSRGLGDGNFLGTLGYWSDGDLRVNGRSVSKSLPTYAPGDRVTVGVAGGALVLRLNGTLVAHPPVNTKEVFDGNAFRFGASLWAEGHAVAIGEEDLHTVRAAADQVLASKDSRHLSHGLSEDWSAAGPTALHFMDQLLSVNCDVWDKVAAAVASYDATVVTREAFDAKEGKHAAEFHVISSGAVGERLAVGVAPVTCAECHNTALGDVAGSVALWSDGVVQQDGYAVAFGLGFGDGDRVDVTVASGGNVSFAVNGEHAATAYTGEAMKHYRFGVSLPHRHQALSIGTAPGGTTLWLEQQRRDDTAAQILDKVRAR